MQLPLAIESKLLLCLLDGPSIHPWRPLISYRPPPAAPPPPSPSPTHPLSSVAAASKPEAVRGFAASWAHLTVERGSSSSPQEGPTKAPLQLPGTQSPCDRRPTSHVGKGSRRRRRQLWLRLPLCPSSSRRSFLVLPRRPRLSINVLRVVELVVLPRTPFNVLYTSSAAAGRRIDPTSSSPS